MSSDKVALEVEARAIAAERLTFFADAVVAIALTLLAIELPLPKGLTNADLLHAAAEHRGDYIAFLVSFLAIGAHWRSHHRLFRYVSTLGGGLVRLTFGWLLMQVLTPFATKVIAGDGAFEARFTFYAAVQLGSLVLFLLMAWQIQRHHLYREDTPPEVFQRTYRGAGLMATAFAVSIPVAFVTHWAYVCWALVPVAEWLWGRRLKTR
jgi:uncharacterized membrane protein